MSEDTATAVDRARDYYDSSDADTFYATIWGGEDIHVGVYETPDEAIASASQRTVERMADELGAEALGAEAHVLDLGAGYGGAARWLADRYGCRVECLNLSRVQNERNRELTARANLRDRVGVTDGSFEELPYADASFDVAWSEDAFLHSADRQQAVAEVARVLKPGGHFVFTDPMQADDCPEGVLQPILDRIHLSTLGSLGFYRETCRGVGLEEVGFVDLTPHLTRHYDRVRQELERREDELVEAVSRDYVERMKAGLGHWVRGGQAGHLAWGILHFRKGGG